MRAAAVVLILSLCAANAWPQSSGVLTGTVASVAGAPLAHARISIAGTTQMVVSATDGTFRIAGVPALLHTVDVRMLGYTPLARSVAVRAGDSSHISFTLVPIPLEPVDVLADYGTPEIRAFAERRAKGPGTFFTREEIQRMQPRLLTDVLRRVPGLQVRPIGGSYGNVSVQTRGSGCQVLFYMNGTSFPIPAEQPINNFVSPDEVVALEVYSGSSEIPAQFNSSRFDSRCGVVVIWTRFGPEHRRRN